MLNDLLLLVLTLICLMPILYCYKDVTFFYQYPVLSSISTLVFYYPTLFIINGQDKILNSNIYTIYLINTIICILAGYTGYYFSLKNSRNFTIKKHRIFSYSYLLKILSTITVIGGVASALIPASEFGNENTGGVFAITLYFARYLRPAAIILFCLYLGKRRYYLLILFSIWLFFNLKFSFVSGRRSEFFVLVMVFSFPLFLVKNLTIKKSFILPGIFMAVIIIMLLPIIRPYMKSGEYYKISSLSIDPILLGFTSGERTNEIIDGALNMAAVEKTKEFSYGYKHVINSIINQYFSSTIFGSKFKEQFFLKTTDMSKMRELLNDSNDQHGYLFYLTPTGFANAFTEFYYFGCLMYFGFAYLSGMIYRRAIFIKRIDYIVMYCYFSLMTLMAFYDSIPSVIGLYFIPYLIVYVLCFRLNSKTYEKKVYSPVINA